MNDTVFLVAAACCVAFLILIVVLMERYNRLRDQLIADEAAGVLSPSHVSMDVASARAPGTSPESPPFARSPAGTAQLTVGTSLAVDSDSLTAVPTGITGEHTLRAQVHELTQLLSAVNESLHHYSAERARETEQLTVAMRTLGEALTAVSRRMPPPDVASTLQAVEQKLNRIIGLLQKGGGGGA